MISAVVNTRNAERYLSLTLRSLRTWVQEIVVVDMASGDSTVDIAREAGAVVLSYPPVGYVEPARAFAVSQVRNDWVVIVDADELVPKPLSERLAAIAASNSADVVSVPHLNYMLGEACYHSGWEPDVDRHFRFFRRGMLRFSSEIHSVPEPVAAARVLLLPFEPGEAFVHLAYADVGEFVERLNRYTTIEARALVEAGKSISAFGATRDSLGEVWRRYVRHRGFRHGWRGSALAILMVFYRVTVWNKARELAANDGVDFVEVAEQVLRDYDELA